MPTEDTRPYHMRVSEDFIRKVDDWRRKQPDIPARAVAIRRLVDLGLQADSKIEKPS